MARRIGTVSGIALRPGVSRNGRLYTKEMVAEAVERAQGRLGDLDALPLVDRRPLDQRTHHASDDDSTRVIGRLTSLSLESDGSARFTADLADTAHARTIAALIAPKGDGPDEVEPFLKGVSIRGAWVGKPRRVQHEGQDVETADGVVIDGLDYTARPGVHGAEIDGYTPATPAGAPGESEPERVLIYESVQEATVTMTEADTPAVSKRGSGLTGDGGTVYADPGYQADKKQRYDISTKAKAKAAWSYVNQEDNARAYTSAQLKRVKQRIVKALKKFGVTVDTKESWLIEPAAAVTEALAECWGMDSADAGNLYVSLTNGPTTVTVSSYSLDPHDLDAVGRAAMAGAVQAIIGIDPDLDADVDVPGEPDDDTATATAAGTPCPCGCGCAIPDVPGGCPCGCESCMHCKGETDEDDDTMESLAYVTPGTTPTAAHWRLLQESGLLAPGVVVTATLVNEAIDARRALTETSAPETPAADNPTQVEEEGPAMAESTTPAAETAAVPATGGVHLTDDQFAQLLARVSAPAAPAAPAESAPAAPVAEAAPEPVQETEEQRIERLVAERVAAALPQVVQQHVAANGAPARKGLVPPVTETAPAGTEPGLNEHGVPAHWPNKPLHEYTPDERAKYFGPTIREHVLRDRFRG